MIICVIRKLHNRTINKHWRIYMATYTCEKCGMSVNTTCGSCDAPLENENLPKDDGSSVQVSKCPNGHGMIKSPMCCGQDMVCTA